MFRGSALEYRLERDNEIVCLECGAKRKDLCRTKEGGICDGHQSRARYARLEQEHDDLEERAYQKRIAIENYRAEVRAAWPMKGSADG